MSDRSTSPPAPAAPGAAAPGSSPADAATGRPRGPRPAKRAAIMDAARRVFGRDGYSRASIDAIAAEAGVSTRTIYNHFPGKEVLFTEVLEQSATQVAERFERDLAAALDDGAPPDAATQLRLIARTQLDQRTRNPDHFAMVDRIVTEAGHFPDDTFRRWKTAGPRRVDAEVTRRLAVLAEAGELRVPDVARASCHLSAIALAELRAKGFAEGVRLPSAEIDAAIAAGVDVFLHGYAP